MSENQSDGCRRNGDGEQCGICENLDQRLRHDIRIHLQCINISTDALQQIVPGDVEEFVNTIRNATRIINELLDLTKVQRAGQAGITPPTRPR